MSDPVVDPQLRSIADVVAKHIQAEIDLDLDTTMATMAENPHLTVFPPWQAPSVRPHFANGMRTILLADSCPPTVRLSIFLRRLARPRLSMKI